MCSVSCAQVCLCTSTVPGLGYGICAAQRIPQGTWIGPFQGVPLFLDKLQSGAVRNTRHLWEVRGVWRVGTYWCRGARFDTWHKALYQILFTFMGVKLQIQFFWGAGGLHCWEVKKKKNFLIIPGFACQSYFWFNKVKKFQMYLGSPAENTDIVYP